jgi:hypothetical protein
MKKRKTPFLEQLRQVIKELKDMKPDEMHVITVHANYGNYELVIGPEDENKEDGQRPVEINGEIHHLFLSPGSISANPSKKQIRNKLKHTVIMQDLSIHLEDYDGEGEHATGHNGSSQGVMPRGMINMAGKEGEELIHKVEESGELNDITYHIIQDDILHALKKEEEEKTLEL